ncbi:MAG: aspartate ammonia-lyase [Candidatus Sumerlaeota bacterium]|nr:aspartate ammonia-lyase [Candidatus Sumerlaeota bacterium]
MKTRTEHDSLGTVEIPAEAYWGATTQRALECFPISGLRHHPVFIDAYTMLKLAAAEANRRCGVLEPRLADAIVRACHEILDGKWRDQFVVDVFQMGAGTSIHMNVNEVLANRANELLGGAIGTYDPVSPNDHVNFGQSTNDTFPTAMRLAILLLLRDHLHEPLVQMEKAFLAKGTEFDAVVKSGRTHLQDAVPIRLGQEFRAYGEALRKCHASIAHARKGLCALGIGGSAAGTGLNTAPGYRDAVIEELKNLSGIRDLEASTDMREAMQSQRPVAEISAALRNLALELGRIANDLRLLASGPATGLAEIVLPAVAPGSSIMPGKVNPSMLECTNMVCFEVIGNDTAVAWAVGAGQLELNVMMPLMQHKVLTSIHVLGTMTRELTNRCIRGIEANEPRCRRYAESSMGLATALNTHIGYHEAGRVAKKALAEGRTLLDIVREEKLLSDDDLARALDPAILTEPGIPGKTRKERKT